MSTKKSIYNKFTVSRVDGQDQKEGDKHYQCDYFVLDVTHDIHAIPALHAYVESVTNENPSLAIDLLSLAIVGLNAHLDKEI